MNHQVAVFTPFPFVVGQKIHIATGPRTGDWLVIGLSERKVQLRCPVSGREVEWDRFCYLSETREQEWPLPR
ncbi:hypothetical protein [Thiovibrio frasassiensis]|jgi:hypothetical protein|uniref:Uncharacterized protein n=1 Tax=Thiovibrio frasassiensis TaxID=2984131 RepID=A0A9X4RKG9_9BACT|nr:hypothetical protein [Thiovibrio frasassiensis]MDG4475026.1 hypothetical protein [Thiovibrio frasassiensis]